MVVVDAEVGEERIKGVDVFLGKETLEFELGVLVIVAGTLRI